MNSPFETAANLPNLSTPLFRSRAVRYRYSNQTSLLSAITNLKYNSEKTNTSHALDVARTAVFGGSGDRPEVPNVAIMLTDGLPSNKSDPFVDGRSLARAAADKLKSSDVQLITVGVTNWIDAVLLQKLSSYPHLEEKNYFKSADFNKLGPLIAKIIASTCITTTPPPCKVTAFIVYISLSLFRKVISVYRDLLPLSPIVLCPLDISLNTVPPS